MSVEIERAVLHALDPASGMPVLSEEVMALDETAREFLEAHFETCLESDGAQLGQLREDSGFGQRMLALRDAFGIAGGAGGSFAGGMTGGSGYDAVPWEEPGAADVTGGTAGMSAAIGAAEEQIFVDESKFLAEQFYQIISGNPSIPAGDLICLMARDGMGRVYFAGLKMNYHDGFSHYYMNGCLSIVSQRVMLPGTGRKLTEAFLVDLASLQVRIIEKTYQMMDESREAYLSSRILGCVPEISEKSKLMAVKKAVQKANKEVLGDQKIVEQELLSRMHGYLVEEEAPTVAQLCQEVFRDYPQIEPMVEERLASDNIDPESTVDVLPGTLKRFEKQSVKTPDGIEVKIPADLYQDRRAMEFIQNPDGTISLLIKNVMV